MLTRLQRAVEVIRLFDTVQPTGITPIGDRLNAILNDYLDELDAAKKAMREEAARSFKTDAPRKTKLPKPVNILVLTDGVPSEPSLSSIACVHTADPAHSFNSGRSVQRHQGCRHPHGPSQLPSLASKTPDPSICVVV